MRYDSVSDLIRRAGPLLRDGPLAVILAEEPVDLNKTVRHHLGLGFQKALVFAPDPIDVPGAWVIRAPTRAPDALSQIVTPVLQAAHGAWVYWGYQGEFLTFPFADTRDIRDALAFQGEERRKAMAGVVIDLYGPRDAPQLDRLGYRAEPGTTPRELAIYGGLRRRFADWVPADRRRIDRVPLVRGASGLSITPDGQLSDPDRMDRACPWHANMTCAVLSHRTARALQRRPGFRADMSWAGSTPWSGSSQQIIDLGLMEPGQWF